jgi:hypothetical protein
MHPGDRHRGGRGLATTDTCVVVRDAHGVAERPTARCGSVSLSGLHGPNKTSPLPDLPPIMPAQRGFDAEAAADSRPLACSA